MKSKPWLCGSGAHVVGLVVWNGNGVAQLALTPDPIPDGSFAFTVVTGKATIYCPECQTTRLWDVSVEALVEMFRHLDAGQVFEFSKRLLESAGPPSRSPRPESMDREKAGG